MKREDVFERVSPPPGGLADLRERIERRPPLVPRAVWTRVRSARLPLGLALAAAVVAFLVLQSRPSPPDLIARARAKDDGAEMFLGLAPVQREPVALAAGDNATSAIERVPTSRADVAFYWIGSTRENP